MVFPQELNPTLLFFAFVIGLSIGSFLNVIIYRLPIGLSIVSPGSRCSHCKTPIKFYQNIPIFSYIFLGGRCSICKKYISIRYPVVELLTGLLSLSLFCKYGISFEYLFLFILTSILVAVTFIDIDYQIIPDEIIVFGLIAGLLYGILSSKITLVHSVIGGISGFSSLYILGFVYTLVTGRMGLGGGDMKLMAVVGLFLGVFPMFLSLMIGSFFGVIYSLTLIFRKKITLKQPIPYGPFLSLGTIFVLFELHNKL